MVILAGWVMMFELPVSPKDVRIGDASVASVVFANNAPLALMAGTCALEGRKTTFRTAEALVRVCGKLGIPLVYKGSFDKANRTSAKGARGMGLRPGWRCWLMSARNLAFRC